MTRLRPELGLVPIRGGASPLFDHLADETAPPQWGRGSRPRTRPKPLVGHHPWHDGNATITKPVLAAGLLTPRGRPGTATANQTVPGPPAPARTAPEKAIGRLQWGRDCRIRKRSQRLSRDAIRAALLPNRVYPPGRLTSGPLSPRRWVTPAGVRVGSVPSRPFYMARGWHSSGNDTAKPRTMMLSGPAAPGAGARSDMGFTRSA